MRLPALSWRRAAAVGEGAARVLLANRPERLAPGVSFEQAFMRLPSHEAHPERKPLYERESGES